MKTVLTTAALVLALGLNAYAAGQKELNMMGNFEGEFTKTWTDLPISAQIVALGKGEHVAKMTVDGRTFEVFGKTKGKAEDGLCLYDDTVDLGPDMGGKYRIVGQVTDGVFSAKVEGETESGAFELKRVMKGSPTLGKKPPEDAVVLMDGTSMDAWVVRPYWQLIGGNAMGMRTSSITTKEEFGSAQYHIEFKTPFMPEETPGSQGRGNSGVYLMGRYEVQVLDSFTEEPRDNYCGGIYKKAVPLVNACLPPEEWQTYDITFHAPEYDASGKKTKDAVISVVHNGKVIHDNVVLPDVTPGGVSGEEAPVGVLMFQDHSDDVNFRNVWVKPLD